MAKQTKWTAGEIRQIWREGDRSAAMEVLQYLAERGPSVIDWSSDYVACDRCYALAAPKGDERVLCERCIALDAELAAEAEAS